MWWTERKGLATPPAQIVFDVTNHPTRLHVIEALRGKAGFSPLHDWRWIPTSARSICFSLDLMRMVPRSIMKRWRSSLPVTGRVKDGDSFPESVAAKSRSGSRASCQGNHQPIA